MDHSVEKWEKEEALRKDEEAASLEEHDALADILQSGGYVKTISLTRDQERMVSIAYQGDRPPIAIMEDSPWHLGAHLIRQEDGIVA